jgi:hypothetical protein
VRVAHLRAGLQEELPHTNPDTPRISTGRGGNGYWWWGEEVGEEDPPPPLLAEYRPNAKGKKGQKS